MSDRAAFVSAVAAAANDDLPKLVFADWLDEHNDPDRAEFIRLSVACHREADAFPPTPDPAKLARLRELFQANSLAWLRPVYEPLGQPLPAFGPPHGPRPNDDRWSVQSHGGVVVLHHTDRALPSVVLHAGLVSTFTLRPARLPESASLAAAMTAEPLDVLHLTVPAVGGGWERFDGPHLGRVRALTVRVTGSPGDNARPLARHLCDPARFRGLRNLTVTPEWLGGDGPPAAVLFDALCASPIRRQLTTLSLYDLPGVARLLARTDHGFDALRELIVGTRGLADEARALFTGGYSNWFRTRLTRLVSDTSAAHGLDWLTGGRAWDCLERLYLSGGGVGDVGAVALAQTDTLPALRELRLGRVRIGNTGAVALAASPLVARLRALVLDGNPIYDPAAMRLAEALDRGLGYLSLRDCRPTLSADFVHRMAAKYGPRIAFGG